MAIDLSDINYELSKRMSTNIDDIVDTLDAIMPSKRFNVPLASVRPVSSSLEDEVNKIRKHMEANGAYHPDLERIKILERQIEELKKQIPQSSETTNKERKIDFNL